MPACETDRWRPTRAGAIISARIANLKHLNYRRLAGGQNNFGSSVSVAERNRLGSNPGFRRVQKTLDCIAEALAKGGKVELRKLACSTDNPQTPRRPESPKPSNRRADPRPRHGQIQGRQRNARRS